MYVNYDNMSTGKILSILSIYNTLPFNKKHDYFKKNMCSDLKKYKLIKKEYNVEDIIIKTEFSKHILENYMCQICRDLMYPCLVLYCGHSFCEKCAAMTQQTEEEYARCFYCRSEVDGFCTNYTINNIIGSLNIVCPNNCEWKGNLDCLNNHLQYCEYQNISCALCNNIMIFKNFKNHSENECAFKKSKCKYCDCIGPYTYLHEHEKNCQNNMIVCTKCNYKIQSNRLLYHNKYECIYREVECKYCFIKTTNIRKHIIKCNGHIGYCPCCEKYNVNTILHSYELKKHIDTCEYYYKMVYDNLWTNHTYIYKYFLKYDENILVHIR